MDLCAGDDRVASPRSLAPSSVSPFLLHRGLFIGASMQSKVFLFPLFKGLHITTNGVGGSNAVLDLEPAGFRNILPHAEGITIYSLMTGRPAADTNLEWSIFLISGFDRDHEYASPVNLLGASYININGPARSTEYTTTSNFLLESRLQLQFHSVAGLNAAQGATIGAVPAVRTFGV